MPTISQREMRNSSGEILRRVEAGESFVVTNRGREVAQLIPLGRPSNPERDRLIADGVLRDRRLKAGPLPQPVPAVPELDGLLDELRGE